MGKALAAPASRRRGLARPPSTAPPRPPSPPPPAAYRIAAPLSFFPCRLDFGSKPIERQLILSAQFLHNELPVRLSHRVAELENLPYGLSAKTQVLKVSALQQHSARAVQGRENSQRYTAGLGQRSGQQCSLPPSRQATR